MVLITGASSGIGEACAHIFAENKKNLVLIARREEKLQKLAKLLHAKHCVEVFCFEVDVRDREAVARFAHEQSELLSKVTVLINNAGLAKGMSTIQDARLEDWEAMIDTNLKGLLYITHAVLPFFIKKNEGHIINLGSVAGHYVYPKGNVYCATKHAVRALSESLRLDLNGTSIRVTEVSPGMVETEFSRVRLGDDAKAKAVYQGMTPLTAQDVAETIAWCVSRPKHVNIQELVLYPTDQASPTVVHRRG